VEEDQSKDNEEDGANTVTEWTELENWRNCWRQPPTA